MIWVLVGIGVFVVGVVVGRLSAIGVVARLRREVGDVRESLWSKTVEASSLATRLASYDQPVTVSLDEFNAMRAARCELCGYFHGDISCPRVKRVIYRADRSVASVEYLETWDKSQVIVIEDVKVDDQAVPPSA